MSNFYGKHMRDPGQAMLDPAIPKEKVLVLQLQDVGLHEIHLVGGKNASLGEMIQQLMPQGIKVPLGFATTAYAYQSFMDSAGLSKKLQKLFAGLDAENVQELQQVGQQARSLMLQASFPAELTAAITNAYQEMCTEYGKNTDVAVRSSATAEDLPDASFAGQQETYLNVHGLASVLEACHKCFASIFTDRAISYRQLQGFDHLAVSLSVGIQKMVRSDLACSGVMFSIDTESGFKDVALITAAYGLGENVVQGSVNPDEYFVFKPTLKTGHRPILKKRLGSKEIKLVYSSHSSEQTKNIPVPIEESQQFALTDDEILQLGRWATQIEEHYSQVCGRHSPMDIEWAKDGRTGELFIVQARPETVQSQKSVAVLRSYHFTVAPTDLPIVTGRAVGDRIGQGPARVILEIADIKQFQAGEVLVTDRTDPDWEPIMKRASAIVTNKGGRTCHAAIIARELGIPAIVGCGDATTKIVSGQTITASCAEGEEGRIYDGLLPFHIEEIILDTLLPTRTQILMNVGNPEEALQLAAIPNDGVGLARLEFIIANHIKVHPLALLNFDRLTDKAIQAQIAEQTLGYDNKAQFFVDKIAQGVGTIAAAFYPKPVIVRLSDFKSNEYANLLGGREFEPHEENPMLGWRGAARYCDERYRAGFALECVALKRVRADMGLDNMILMVPFCRTPEEGRTVIAEMAKHGLIQGQHGLQIYVMCELPSNVMMAAEFCEIFDGFSIGSNDLTQLTLGLDRDSALVAHLFDERNLAVQRLITIAISTAKAHGRKIGICGQAPSDYPEFAQFLVAQGIDSISLNPDSVIKTRLAIAAIEQI
jgi:pyruvate, water dikinase